MIAMRSRTYYILASTVGIAGALHLFLGLTLLKMQFLQFAEFFFLAGSVQVVWAILMPKILSRGWLYTGRSGN